MFIYIGTYPSEVAARADYDAGQACLLVIGESTIQSAIEKAGLKPDKHVDKQVDASSKDVDGAVVDTAKQLG